MDNLNLVYNNISRFTFGLKFSNERFDLLNKFGLFYDSLNEDNNWSQRASIESGHQLLNLFEYANKKENYGLFISTSRLGFNFAYLKLNKKGLKYLINEKINSISHIFNKLIEMFDEFQFQRFGLYFELFFPLEELKKYSKTRLFRWMFGTNDINSFDEFSHRSSKKINHKSKHRFQKVILQLNKVKNTKNEIGYLLIIDFQDFFNKKNVKSKEEMVLFFKEKVDTIYTSFETYISDLLVDTG